MSEHPGTTHLAASEQLRRIIDGKFPSTDSGLIYGLAVQLLADLDAATAKRWTDERDGAAYDLTGPLRDANGDYWHHVGWLTLPDRLGLTPMVMWSMSANREDLSRRWADVAPLVNVIDESGPFGAALDAALDAKAEDDRIEVERTR